MRHFGKFRLASLWLIVLLAGCSPAETQTSADGDAVGNCDLVIRFNGKAEDREFQVPCPPSSTVLTVMRSVPNGSLEFEMIGADNATAFIVSIGGVENEKNLGDNWVYRVNGKLGDKSSGLFPVQPGDSIVWSFGKYEPSE